MVGDVIGGERDVGKEERMVGGRWEGGGVINDVV